MSTQILSNLPRLLRGLSRALVAPLLLAALGACGGGGGAAGSNPAPQGCSASSCGSALLTLTDATGDFTSYTVDVTSLKLTKANGAVVETLPIKTRVDFAELVNLTEFLTAATIPNGDYVSASMTVDYSAAQVFVEVNGMPVQATLVDGSGAALGSMTLTVALDNKHHLVVAPGKPARLALDFNLAASNTVDLTGATPVVTVKPFIVASVVPPDSKDLRVRGALAGVDTMAASYTVDLRPFDDQSSKRGQVTVQTTTTTTFEVDGTGYTGSAGIGAMSALAAGSLTVAFGTLSTADQTFTATRVLAGSSVEMPSFDGLRGVVIARSGDTLTVRGATLFLHTDGGDHFKARDVTLTIGDATRLTAAGEPAAVPTKAWPSVGSRITAFGTAGTDSAGNPTFDATAGRVRLEITSLWGYPVSSNPGEVTLNVQAIEGRAPAAFNFAGTGISPAQDSNPAAYVVATGALPVTSLMPAAPTRFFGLVQPFGSAPPDFNARTLVDFSAVSAGLEVSFGDGSTAAFSAINATDLVINLADPLLGRVHVIKIGPQLIDLTKLAASPEIVPDATGPNLFAIRTEVSGGGDSLSVYASYADFAAALGSKLGGTTKVRRVLATGHFDAAANVFTARQIAVSLHD